jgi:hypothetical protein
MNRSCLKINSYPDSNGDLRNQGKFYYRHIWADTSAVAKAMARHEARPYNIKYGAKNQDLFDGLKKKRAVTAAISMIRASICVILKSLVMMIPLASPLNFSRKSLAVL